MRRNSVLLSLGLGLALASVGCGGAPMTTTAAVTEGVTGPLNLPALPSDDLTTLKKPDSSYSYYSFSHIYIQAVVKGVKVGDTIAVRHRTGQFLQSFIAPEAGNVGLMFNLDPPSLGWSKGSYIVYVTHGERQVGSASYTIK